MKCVSVLKAVRFWNRFNCPLRTLFVIYCARLFSPWLFIAADGHENRISDTEELLGSAFAEKESLDRSRTSCTTPLIDPRSGPGPGLVPGPDPFTLPPCHADPPEPAAAKQHLNLEVITINNNHIARMPPLITGRLDSEPKAAAAWQRLTFFQEFSCDVSLEGGVDKKGQERQEFSFTLYDFDGYGKITKDVSTTTPQAHQARSSDSIANWVGHFLLMHFRKRKATSSVDNSYLNCSKWLREPPTKRP